MQGDRLALIGHDGAVLWSGPPAPGAVAILSDDPPALRMIDPAHRAAPVTALAG